MDAISAVSTAWTVGSHAVSLLKGAAEQAKALGKSEIITSLIDVQVAMMELLSEQQKLVDENRALREKLHELEAVLEKKKNLEFYHNAYWSRDEDGALDGPFSTQDWDLSKYLVRLVDRGPTQIDGTPGVLFHNISNNESVFIPLAFLKNRRVRAYVWQEI